MSQHPNSLANLKPPWKPGESGNPGGKLKGFNRILKELLRQRDLCGQPTPDGQTVEQYLAESVLVRAIKGDNICLVQILDRIYGQKGEISDGTGRRVVFEIVDNGRGQVPELGEETDLTGDTKP